MTQQLSTPFSLHRRRHQEQIGQRSQSQRDELAHLAARTFIPVRGAHCFDKPIQPMNSVVLAVLNFSRKQDGSYCHYFRGFQAWFERPLGITHWGRPLVMLAHDLEQPFSRGQSGIPLAHSDLCRTALDLDANIDHAKNRCFLLKGHPVLPPTLLAHAAGAPVNPEATPMVMRHAEINNIPWEEAWHQLRQELRVPKEYAPDGTELIDTRLVATSQYQMQGCRGVYLDLRAFLGRPTTNHLRHRAFGHGLDDAQLASQARTTLPPHLQRDCTDDDLLKAIREPSEPLLRSRVAAIQVWVPPASGGNAFVFSDFGLRADLHNVRPDQLKRLGLPNLLDQAAACLPQVA